MTEREAAAWAAKWLEDNAFALIEGKSSRDEAIAAVALRRAMQQLAALAAKPDAQPAEPDGFVTPHNVDGSDSFVRICRQCNARVLARDAAGHRCAKPDAQPAASDLNTCPRCGADGAHQLCTGVNVQPCPRCGSVAAPRTSEVDPVFGHMTHTCSCGHQWETGRGEQPAAEEWEVVEMIPPEKQHLSLSGPHREEAMRWGAWPSRDERWTRLKDGSVLVERRVKR